MKAKLRFAWGLLLLFAAGEGHAQSGPAPVSPEIERVLAVTCSPKTSPAGM
jgi:hypothetical protein